MPEKKVTDLVKLDITQSPVSQINKRNVIRPIPNKHANTRTNIHYKTKYLLDIETNSFISPFPDTSILLSH